MLRLFKNFWKEMFELTKTWSIRKQMLLCYVIAMILILILIMIVVLVNIYILRMNTVSNIDSTLDKQAKENMIQLTKETSVLMHSQITQIGAMFDLIQNFLNGMEDEATFSLQPLLSYTALELPEKCWTYDNSGMKVCSTFSSFTDFSNSSMTNSTSSLLNSVSRLDNIWPSIWKLTQNVAIRYYIYFNDSMILKNFPGVQLPEGYNLTEQLWYKASKAEIFSKPIATSAYADPFPTGYSIISVAYPLINITTGKSIGLIGADLPLQLQYLLYEIYLVTYLKTGFTSIVYKDGTIIHETNIYGNSGFWPNNSNLNEIDKDLWNNLQTKPNETHFFIYKDNVYRVSGYSLGINMTTTLSTEIKDFYYMVLLIVEESDIMEYRDESKLEIESIGNLLIIITITCSVITLAVVTVLIHFLAKSITAPLKGIIEFTNKINARATEKDMVTKEELDELKEGDDQVAELVKTYKELAGSLITRKDDRIPKPLQVSQNRVFPRNELYQRNKLDWKNLISQLPN